MDDASSSFISDSMSGTSHSITKCPICGSHSVELMYSLSSVQVVDSLVSGPWESKSTELLQSVEQVWNRKFCQFFKCNHCSFSFSDPFISATERVYSLLYCTTLVYPESKWEFERTLSSLKFLTDCGQLGEFSITDIGAGVGGFVSQVSTSFSKKIKILCTEYSETSVSAIRRSGISCFHGGLMDLDLKQYLHSFDILCLFQVLEHMDDLDSVFEQLTLLASENAHIFIAVPNYKMRAYFDALGFFEDRPPIHVSRWNRYCLEMLATRHGWKLLEDEIQPESYFSKLKHYAALLYTTSPSVMKLRKIELGFLRRTLIGGLIVLLLARSLRSVIGLKDNELGTAYWAHLTLK